jgi:two-component system phosphate regulon sensor histidine kinase PhoR
VANVSHELRTPLASVKSVIETLQGGALEEQATARDFLTRMDMEVDRLVNLVEELLELSRIESGEVPLVRRPVSIGEVVVSAVERMRPAARRRRLKLSVDVPPQLPPVVGDAARLERVVVSLVDNAIKFTMPEGAVQVSAALNDGRVAITVRDTGVGIDPQDLARTFERFYKADRSRQGGGTGLGLAIVKHTVEAHGGSVAVESEPGRGSAFTIFVPVSSSPSAGS